MNAPEVSIIVPCKNYGHFLAATLDALLAQTFTQWECIVVNNGSTDNTEQLVSTYAQRDGRFRLLNHNGTGVSAARNAGLRAARGAWIQFLDADDLLQPNKLASQLQFLSARADVDVVYGPARYFFDGKPEELRYSRHAIDKPWMPEMQHTNLRALLRHNIAPIQSPLVRKSDIDACGGFDESLTGYEDWALFLTLALNGASFCYHEASNDLSLVRLHGTSTSQNERMMSSFLLPVFSIAIFHTATPLRLRLLALMRYGEEFWKAVFKLNFTAWRNSARAHMLKFLLLSLASILLLPLVLLLLLYRQYQSM